MVGLHHVGVVHRAAHGGLQQGLVGLRGRQAGAGRAVWVAAPAGAPLLERVQLVLRANLVIAPQEFVLVLYHLRMAHPPLLSLRCSLPQANLTCHTSADIQPARWP